MRESGGCGHVKWGKESRRGWMEGKWRVTTVQVGSVTISFFFECHSERGNFQEKHM